MEEIEGKDLLVDTSAGLIDISMENDSLVMAAGTSTLTVTDTDFDLESHQFSGTSHADKALDSEKLPQLLETSEPKIATKNVKCNLRKSLAWDSAFFTSPGVLDAEELSTMIEGGEKGVKHFLPGIQEDVHTSMDSISTLESDNFTLESLEAELFEDIRASIQKSSRASNMATLSSNAAPGGKTPQAKASTSSKNVDLATRKGPMLKSTVKTPNSAMTGSGKMIKQSKNSPQDTQVTRIRESTSAIPRPVKSISKVNPMPTVATKRASLSANHFKVENNNTNSTSASLKGTQASKPTSLIGPRRGQPKSSTASKTESMRPSSSCGSSGSSSDNVGKSVLTSARRNNSKVNSSGPIPKPHSRTAPRCKISGPTDGPSIHMISSKLSSSISPASSISDWSVESSSSTSTVNQTSISRTSIDSSCRSSNGDLHLNTHVVDKTSDRKNQRTELSSQNLKKAATQASSISRPDSMKPSGLRMPSPKIGYFDGSKSVRTPNGGVQSQARLSTGFPKLGPVLSSPTGNSIKATPGKLQPTKVMKPSTYLKPDSRSSSSPRISKELPNQLTKATIVSKDAKNCPVKSPEVQPEVVGSSCLQIELKRDSGKLENANNEINMQEIAGLKEIVIPFAKEEITDSTLDTYGAEIKPHGGVEDAKYGLDYSKNKSPGEINGKSADHFGDRIDDLAKDFVAMDLQLSMQNDVAGNTSSCSSPCVRELCSKQNLIDVIKEGSTTDFKEIANNKIYMHNIAGSEEIVIPFPKGEITDSTLDTYGVEDAICGLDYLKNKSPGETNEKAADCFGDRIDDLKKDFVAMDLQLAMQTEVKSKFKEIVICPTEGEITSSNFDMCVGVIEPNGVDEDAIHGQDDHKNKLSDEVKEMETDHFEDQIDDLAAIEFFAKDLEDALQKAIGDRQDDHKNKLSDEMKELEIDPFKDEVDDLAVGDLFSKDLLSTLQKAIAYSSESSFELSNSNPCSPGIRKSNGVDEDAIHGQDNHKNELSGEMKEIETDPFEDETDDLDEDAIHGQDADKNDLSGELKETESDPFEDQIDDLAAIDFFAKDILIALHKAIADSTESCCEQTSIDVVQKEKPTADFEEFVVPLQVEGIKDSDVNTHDGKIKTHGPGEDAIHEDYLKNKARGENNEKETNSFGDQVDDLPRKIVAIEGFAINSRTPLIEKNSLDSSKGFDILTGSVIEAVEKTADLPSSEIAQKENS